MDHTVRPQSSIISPVDR